MSRNYRKEYDNYHKKPAQKKNRAARNKARSCAKKAGKAIQGKDVGHKKSLKSGGSKGCKNTKVQSRKSNRAHGGRIGDRRGKAAGGRKGGKR